MPAMPLARHGREKDNAPSGQVRGPTGDAALDVLVESVERKKTADDSEHLVVPTIRDNSRSLLFVAPAEAGAQEYRFRLCRSGCPLPRA